MINPTPDIESVLAALEKAKLALEQSEPQRDYFYFGPAYEAAVENHKNALKEIRKVLRRLRQK